MLPYEYQLAHKRRVIEKAYANFSSLPASAVPVIGETFGSPLEYAYRTKLTPHFDAPPGARGRGRKKTGAFKEMPAIGFMKKGMRSVVDIEECPIATETVQVGLRRERARVERDLAQYSKGATLLLRESTRRVDKDADAVEMLDGDSVIREERETDVLVRSCVTKAGATTMEYVGEFVFTNEANSFFRTIMRFWKILRSM